MAVSRENGPNRADAWRYRCAIVVGVFSHIFAAIRHILTVFKIFFNFFLKRYTLQIIHLDGKDLTEEDVYLAIEPVTISKVNDGPFEMSDDEATFVDDFLEKVDNQPYQ